MSLCRTFVIRAFSEEENEETIEQLMIIDTAVNLENKVFLMAK